jgi:hypothetical protein
MANAQVQPTPCIVVVGLREDATIALDGWMDGWMGPHPVAPPPSPPLPPAQIQRHIRQYGAVTTRLNVYSDFRRAGPLGLGFQGSNRLRISPQATCPTDTLALAGTGRAPRASLEVEPQLARQLASETAASPARPFPIRNSKPPSSAPPPRPFFDRNAGGVYPGHGARRLRARARKRPLPAQRGRRRPASSTPRPRAGRGARRAGPSGGRHGAARPPVRRSARSSPRRPSPRAPRHRPQTQTHTPGPNATFVESHAVVLVGYDIDRRYWIVKVRRR